MAKSSLPVKLYNAAWQMWLGGQPMPADKINVYGGMIASFDENFVCVVFESMFNSDERIKNAHYMKYYRPLTASPYPVYWIRIR